MSKEKKESKSEKLIASVQTLEEANEIRKAISGAIDHIWILVKQPTSLSPEYKIEVMNGWQGRLPEDKVLTCMEVVSELQKSKLSKKTEEFGSMSFPPKADEIDDWINDEENGDY